MVHDSNWLSIAGSKEIKVSLELAVGISRVGGRVQVSSRFVGGELPIGNLFRLFNFLVA